MRTNTVRKSSNKTHVDMALLVAVFSLLLFGLIMIANSTVITSTDIYGNPYKFAIYQAGWIFIGLFGFFFFYKYDYKKLDRIAYLMFLGALGLLGLLAIFGLLPCTTSFGFAPCVNGANRWFYINPPPFPQIPLLGVLGFQPSEFAKLALIVYLSVQLNKISEKKESQFQPFWIYLLSTGLVAFLILLQPNMSTAAMVFAIGTIIYFCSEASLKPLFILFPSLLTLAVGAIFTSPYRRQRLLTLIKGDEGMDLNSGYHIKQILIALGSGGFFGVGFGESKQKYQYLPEVAADSLFALIGEEFGFLGTTILILAFSFLIYKGFTIAKNAPDLLGRLLSVGIISWIGLQFFINVAAMSKIIPLTGVPMPLISYGGSSLFFSLMGLGILANISSQS